MAVGKGDVAVGCASGVAVSSGAEVGSGVGVAEGSGAEVGSGVGVAVAAGVEVGSGMVVALGSGADVGSGVGDAVGSSVGVRVGVGSGAGVGVASTLRLMLPPIALSFLLESSRKPEKSYSPPTAGAAAVYVNCSSPSKVNLTVLPVARTAASERLVRRNRNPSGRVSTTCANGP